MSEKNVSLLIIEDDQNVAYSIAAALQGEFDPIRIINTATEALQLFTDPSGKTVCFDDGFTGAVVIVDVVLPDFDGIELIRRMKMEREGIGCEFIVLTGYPSVDYAVRALRVGAADYLIKPFDTIELRRVATKSKSLIRLKEEAIRMSAAIGKTVLSIMRRAEEVRLQNAIDDEVRKDVTGEGSSETAGG